MGYVLLVPAGEGEPGSEIRIGRKGLADGLGFFEGREGFEGEGFPSLNARQNFDAGGMKGNEVGVGAVVVAMVFGAVVERRAVGSEGDGDQDLARGKFGCGIASEFDGTEQSSVGTFWSEADFGVAHPRDLIAGGLDAVGARFNVGVMNGGDFFGRVFENMRGPEGAVDIRAQVLEFRGQAAIEDVDAVQECLALAILS